MNIAWAALAAFGLGALHSLEPGHGKGVLSAYLVSSRAKAWDAVWLGIVSAAAHTLTIAIVSLAAVSASLTIVPEQMTLWVELVSGLFIVLLGANLLMKQHRPGIVTVGKLGRPHTHTDSCGHDHHHHGHHHHHDDVVPASRLRLAAVGFAAGIVPCPSAVAIMLAAVGNQQTGLGLGLVAAFSVGSAVTMCSVGLMVVQASKYLKKLETRRLLRVASSLSASLIVVLGCAVVLKSLFELA